MTETTSLSVTCPECGAEFALDTGVTVNEIVVCAECGVELEVTSLEPVQIALAPEIEEDWGE